MSCRICSSVLEEVLDYGNVPLANNHQTHLDTNLPRYPLRLLYCKACELLQHDTEVDPAELFRHYQYFSSMSQDYSSSRKFIAGSLSSVFKITGGFSVCEIACNDGYFLSNFVGSADEVFGFEPAEEPAVVAKGKGVTVVNDFFDFEVAEHFLSSQQLKFNLILANNVLAHCPNVLSILEGVELLLSDSGIFICEFPAAEEFLEKCLFDTVYHEHFFYFTLNSFAKIAKRAGLRVIFNSVHPEHGVSHRVGIVREGCDLGPDLIGGLASVFDGSLTLNDRRWFANSLSSDVSLFRSKVDRICKNLLSFCASELKRGKKIGFVGASAKGNSLLNYLINRYDGAEELINSCVGVLDETPAKQGRIFSGTSLYILSKDDYVKRHALTHIVLIWNHSTEVKRRYGAELSGDLVVFMPNALEIL